MITEPGEKSPPDIFLWTQIPEQAAAATPKAVTTGFAEISSPGESSLKLPCLYRPASRERSSHIQDRTAVAVGKNWA